MPRITVECDRCGRTVAGSLFFPGDGCMGFLAGCFDMSIPPWSRMADEGECVVCATCLHADPRYQLAYPSPYDPSIAHD